MRVMINGEKLDIEAGSGEYMRRSKESLYTIIETSTEMSEIRETPSASCCLRRLSQSVFLSLFVARKTKT
jgi:hypothetical protein